MKIKNILAMTALISASNAIASGYIYKIDLGDVNLFPDSEYSYTEWLNFGDEENCTEWSPLESLIDFGLLYQQSMTCEQPQVRDATVIYKNENTGASKEGKTTQQYKTVDVEYSQDAIGTKAELAIEKSKDTLEYQNDYKITATAKNYNNSEVVWDASSNLTVTYSGDSAYLSANNKSNGWVRYKLINGDLSSSWSSKEVISVVNNLVDTRYLTGTTYNETSQGIYGSTLTSNFTIETWVKPHKAIKTGSSSSNVFASGAVSNGTYDENYAFTPPGSSDVTFNGLGISVGTNGLKVFCHHTNYMPNLFVKYVSIPSSSWSHVAVSVRNNVPYVYLNGSYIGSGYAPLEGNLKSPYIVGATISYGAFKGVLAESRIWNKGLLSSEITANYKKHLSSGALSSNGAKVIAKIE